MGGFLVREVACVCAEAGALQAQGGEHAEGRGGHGGGVVVGSGRRRVRLLPERSAQRTVRMSVPMTHGIPPQGVTIQAPPTEAVTELPPVVVSDLFGVTASTACRWGQLASESWTAYLAARDSHDGQPE